MRAWSRQVATPAFGIIGFGTESAVEHAVMTDDAFIMIRDPNNECLHAQAPLGLTMVCMIGFSILVQMAEVCVTRNGTAGSHRQRELRR